MIGNPARQQVNGTYVETAFAAADTNDHLAVAANANVVYLRITSLSIGNNIIYDFGVATVAGTSPMTIGGQGQFVEFDIERHGTLLLQSIHLRNTSVAGQASITQVTIP